MLFYRPDLERTFTNSQLQSTPYQSPFTQTLHDPVKPVEPVLKGNSSALSTRTVPMFSQTVTRALSRLGLDQRGTNPHPRQPAQMLLQKADAMLSSPDWTYEPKWNGFRVLGSVRFWHQKR